nr:hypothetical protein [Tanacetum cinerariifolium]
HRILAGKKTSQRLWMFKVKEEQDDNKSLERYIYTSQKREFSASWAGRKPRVQIEGNFVRTDSSTEASVDDMLVAGSDMAEFNKPKCDVHQVGDEREVKVLRSFNWPPSELI